MVTGNVTYGQFHPQLQRVYYEGADALNAGYPLCYNQDYGTITDPDEHRRFCVEKPSTTNAMYFAGVVAPNSGGKTGPCWIDICLPGSVCLVYSDQNVTAGDRLTAQAGAYNFYTQGFAGKGSAIAMETENLSAVAGLVQAYLEEGPQSGLVEVITPTNVLMTPMLNGVTYFTACDIAVGNATATVADGTKLGQKKAFFCEGAMTTSDIVITVTTEMPVGEWPFTAPAFAFNTWTMDAAAEYLTCEWTGKSWLCFGLVGTTV